VPIAPLSVSGKAKIDPTGSTPIILHPGIFSLNFLAIPVNEPPVPPGKNK